MSEPQPKARISDARTIIFMAILSFVCALILSVLAGALKEPKRIAKDLDRSKQMMIAAQILSHNGYFIVRDKEGQDVPAKYEAGTLVPDDKREIATRDQLMNVYKNRLQPYLVDGQGNLKTFAEAKVDEDQYIAQFHKTGYYKQPLKLIYKILPNAAKSGAKEKPKATGYVIPVSGLGLWDAIYGYLAIEPNGDNVIGISWYDQRETPGLGAGISEAYWQDQFRGKQIFQESSDGKTDYKIASLGITVVKGKVSEVLGSSPKAKSAVDGMSGATLTGNGVTDAYKAVLAPYRPFLLKLIQAYKEGAPK